MASTPRRRRNSMEDPPTLSDVIRLKEEFIAVYERHYHELQEIIKALSHLMKTFEKDFKQYTEGARNGGIVGIAGGITTIAGLALAPFTMGVSVAVVAGVGTGMALSGGIRSGVSNFMKMRDQKKFIQNVKDRLEEFQNKITPMTDILNVICTHINEILRHCNKPESNISGLFKYVAGASELLRFIRIDDMDKLAGNRQISESEMESKAGKFIVEMRKVIIQLQNTLDELKKTKDKLARELDLI